MRIRFALFCLILPYSLYAAPQPAPVAVQTLAEVAVYPDLEAPATVVSLNNAQLGAEINARIVDIVPRVGDTVTQGEVVARLDCTDYELALRRVEAVLQGVEARRNLARAQLERAQSLVARQNISRELLNQREADVRTLQAEYEVQRVAVSAARRDTEKCALHAPFNGVVLERLGQVGETASPGKPLLRVLDLDHIEVSAQVDVDLAEHLQRAQALHFVTRAGRYALRLRALTPAVDVRARSREARLLFSGDQALPGTSGRLVWRDSVPHVRAELVVRRGAQLGVFTVRQGRAEFVTLPEAQEGRLAPAPLPLDTPIVTDGRLTLRDGDAVRVAP